MAAETPSLSKIIFAVCGAVCMILSGLLVDSMRTQHSMAQSLAAVGAELQGLEKALDNGVAVNRALHTIITELKVDASGRDQRITSLEREVDRLRELRE